ncbi:MAG: ATP-binding protein [Terracidiphilus sp.]
MKIRSGITARTTQLTWTITLASLCIFIAITIPEQKHDLQGGLESKGQSIAAGLEGEVASAAVTEDYSSVVEHAMQVIARDPAMEFIVITKSDGYSIVVERDSWRIVPHLDSYWYNGSRVASASIGVESLVGKRVFHYRAPLDCMGMPWGWMHVGLSLNSYDRSVHALYLRTALLGVLCIGLSLMASILFARRFVRPILDLRQAVEKVAMGDLKARACIHTQDEIEQLATAFNDMAEAILQRDRIMESVRFAAQTLQNSDEWDAVIDGVITRFGQSTASSRAILVQVSLRPDGNIAPRIRLEWAQVGIGPYQQLWGDRTAEELGVGQRFATLAHSQLLLLRQHELEAEPFVCPDPAPRSLLAAPIFADGRFWGSLCLQDCVADREWGDVERHSIRAIADMVGASVVRERAQQALITAKNELEQRVAERTQELSLQIAAKDKAHNDLQQAQQKLIELSRMSGMAEVATGVLHNVGNALNSINVSATLISDRMNNTSQTGRLCEVAAMLDGKNGGLGEFLTTDPRGQRIVPYLVKLSEHMQKERGEICGEATSLLKHVEHVKEIVSMQQGYARNCGVLEKVTAEELIENALSLSAPAIDRHGIVIVREFEPLPGMVTDRHKVLQILLNLLQNAKDAVKAGGHQPREIFVRLRNVSESRMRFEVEDNGIGIAPENRARIFSHGFTTKRNGHGFGLHSGALAAMELGGTLSAASAGLGFGATFTLELPLRALNRPEPGGYIERQD